MKKTFNIGIDIDNVLTQTTNRTNILIPKYISTLKEKEIYEKNISNIMSSQFPEELKFQLQECFQEVCQSVPLFPHAKEVITKLHNQGHKIIFITARNDELVPNTEKNTLEYFQKYNIYYDQLLFNNSNKTQACIDNNIDLIIDDSPSVLKSFNSSLTKPILFLNSINSQYREQFTFVQNWQEIAELIESLETK